MFKKTKVDIASLLFTSFEIVFKVVEVALENLAFIFHSILFVINLLISL